MQNRYTALLLTFILAAAFVFSLFLKPMESQANPGTGWRGEYFDNKDLAGTPRVVITNDQINFNWAQSAPYPEIPADNFSVRWTANPNFPQTGLYRFRVGADDGIRLYIDNVLIINDWQGGSFRTTTRDVQLTAGAHNLRVEYYEAVDLAGVLVDWVLTTPAGTVSTAVPATPIPPAATPRPGAVDSQGRPLAHVATGRLNVRANPSISAARIGQVYLYQSYPILGISADSDWYLIDLRDGRSGWVAERYIYRVDDTPVQVVQAATSSAAALPNIEVAGVASAELKIRAFPRRGEQIGLLPQGALIRVLARNSSGSWFLVRSPEGIEGWVFSPYIQLTNGRVMDLPVR